jgi:hypothetical protein
VQDGPFVTWVGQENRQHFMGHLSLWGLREPVMPWCSDGPSEAELGGTMQTTLAHWADAAHAQGGTVIVPHFPGPNGEPGLLVATGRADGVEMLVQAPEFHTEYYRYLNSGYRVPLVGGTDKMDAGVPVGIYRTYARVEGEFSYEAWCAAVRAGRTFLSGGPLIGLEVDGKDIADTVTISGPGEVDVHAWAESIFPMHTLQVVSRGEVVAETTSASGARKLELRARVRVGEHTWLAVRCGGPNYWDGRAHMDTWGRRIFAHTSPVYVAVGGDWEMFDEAGLRHLRNLCDGNLRYVREIAGAFPADRVTHHHGEPDHLAYLERPFLEAQAHVEQRLRDRR